MSVTRLLTSQAAKPGQPAPVDSTVGSRVWVTHASRRPGAESGARALDYRPVTTK